MKVPSPLLIKFLLAFTLICLTTTHLQAMKPLEDYRWKYRLIAYVIPADEVENFFKEIDKNKFEIHDRDIRFIALNPTKAINRADHLQFPEETLQTLHSKLNASDKSTQLILIGKDGGVKKRYGSVNLSAIFGLIDQMPMRQAEMSQ